MKPIATEPVASTDLFAMPSTAPAQPVMAAAPVQQEPPKATNDAFDDLFGADTQPPAANPEPFIAQPVAASTDPFDFGGANETVHSVPM